MTGGPLKSLTIGRLRGFPNNSTINMASLNLTLFLVSLITPTPPSSMTLSCPVVMRTSSEQD